MSRPIEGDIETSLRILVGMQFCIIGILTIVIGIVAGSDPFFTSLGGMAWAVGGIIYAGKHTIYNAYKSLVGNSRGAHK